MRKGIGENMRETNNVLHKIISVKALDDYRLLIGFDNGKEKLYDMKPFIGRHKQFESLLSTEDLFKQVRVGRAGYGIIWNDELDLSCNTLYIDGVDA
jgi:hypothetical protein